MTYENRIALLKKIERIRGGRRLIVLFNFDRPSTPPGLTGLTTKFQSDVKEALFRVLKESKADNGIDLCLYTRGGDTNAVWPIVSIVREFDPAFEVLVPYRCHSAGTLVALGARRIHMTPLAELSPIDPSTGNQFNPVDPINRQSRLGIAVEDIQQYRSFILNQFELGQNPDEDKNDEMADRRRYLDAYVRQLASEIHPLALGNAHRVHKQILQLAEKLLKLQDSSELEIDRAVQAFTQDFYSHMHMINRNEASEFLGGRAAAASDKLTAVLDDLLRQYQDAFKFSEPFFLAAHMGDEYSKEVRFVGGVLESTKRSYLYSTEAVISQRSALPENVQIQLPSGQPVPLVAGLPREFDVQVTRQTWVHNEAPKGVTT